MTTLNKGSKKNTNSQKIVGSANKTPLRAERSNGLMDLKAVVRLRTRRSKAIVPLRMLQLPLLKALRYTLLSLRNIDKILSKYSGRLPQG
jgi:hypothetical protein